MSHLPNVLNVLTQAQRGVYSLLLIRRDQMPTVRQSNMAGPCIPQGVLVRETAKFYVFTSRWNGKETKLVKGWKNHVEPCTCCTDHERTQYPRGYED